jgi:hypothetical protein
MREEVQVIIEGSCECGAVTFSVESSTPYPYRICYCRRCRKLGGAIGAAINVIADAPTLKVQGELEPTRYETSEGPVTAFCPRCGSPLFLEMGIWPDWVYPFAAAVDTPLPEPPHHIHVRWTERQPWVPAIGGPDDPHFEDNTDESMIEWHDRMGLTQT